MLKRVSILGYFCMVGAVAGLVALRSVLSLNPAIIAVQVGALVLFFWARITFGRRSFHLAANPTEGGLVKTGPYRYIRHPIYTAMCLFIAAGVASHWSLGAGACLALALFGALVRIRCEEQLVIARYPEYQAYAATTWRMVPYVY